MTPDAPAAERTALDATHTGTWSWTADGPETLSVRWPGAERAADIRDRIDDESWHILTLRLQKALLDDRPFQAGVPMSRDDGETRGALFRGARSAGATGQLRVVGLCWRDAAGVQTDHQAQWAPLAKLSHELRSPLAAVIGLLREAGQATSRADVRQALDAAHESCAYMARIIQDMLTGFRAGEREPVHGPERLSTGRLLEQVVPVTREQAARKGLDMDLWRDEAFPDDFLADPVAVRRILQNLLDNAVKYTSEGRIALHLKVGADGEDRWLCFEVVDTGPGMSDRDIERAFEPFARGDEGHRRAPGLGIGLALSKQLAAALDGRLEVDSTPGEGSRFCLRIPARVAQTAAPPATSEAAVANVPQGKRVLVVDDHPLLAKLTGRALARLGCDVDVAKSGQDALASIENRVPDVVILDLDLPDVSGWELCRQLAAREQLAHCRFVAYSGSDVGHDRAAMEQAGFDACFVKPASAEELLGA